MRLKAKDTANYQEDIELLNNLCAGVSQARVYPFRQLKKKDSFQSECERSEFLALAVYSYENT